MASIKVNPFSKSNPDTGLGTQAGNIGGRFLNKDGSFNLSKQGLPWLKRTSIYSFLLELSWLQFLGVIVFFYLLLNLIFTAVYLLIGHNQLQGFITNSTWGRIKEVFFFSTQTFTTVGYGRINPVSDGADILASFETMCGWLFFALVTGLLYGRFTRPKAFIAFSDKALISPYRQGTALMFRMVPYKTQHHLSEVKVIVNLSMLIPGEEKAEYRFYQIGLERSSIDMFNMNWTVVHPIDAESPLLNFTADDLEASDLEMMVQITGFDPVFSNIVMQRTSYRFNEIVWGAKFKPMYHETADNNSTVLELDKLNHYEEVALMTLAE